jgi:predicted pyridoxine 5'-phosphate oxidase superfamily flavin-nucleotide-binding protein
VFTEEQFMADTPENGVLEFLSSRKTLVMATVDKNGAPNTSYAPDTPQFGGARQKIDDYSLTPCGDVSEA